MKGTRLELSNAELAKMNKLFRGKQKEINAEAEKGLNKVAMQVAVDAKTNLKTNGSVATNQLSNSVFVRPQTDMTTDVAAEANHAYWVEFGRKAGGMPPIKMILEWVRKKGLADRTPARRGKRDLGPGFEERALSIAFAIAKSIARQGTKARPFLFPAFRKNEADMMRVIGDAIKKVI